jgi:hypothetical protein
MTETRTVKQTLECDAKIDGEIRRHGEETYPHECCGALVGSGNRVTATVALPNTTEEGPRRRFMVRPSDYRVAEQKAGELSAATAGPIAASGSSGPAVADDLITRGRRSRTSSWPSRRESQKR